MNQAIRTALVEAFKNGYEARDKQFELEFATKEFEKRLDDLATVYGNKQ